MTDEESSSKAYEAVWAERTAIKAEIDGRLKHFDDCVLQELYNVMSGSTWFGVDDEIERISKSYPDINKNVWEKYASMRDALHGAMAKSIRGRGKR